MQVTVPSAGGAARLFTRRTAVARRRGHGNRFHACAGRAARVEVWKCCKEEVRRAAAAAAALDGWSARARRAGPALPAGATGTRHAWRGECGARGGRSGRRATVVLAAWLDVEQATQLAAVGGAAVRERRAAPGGGGGTAAAADAARGRRQLFLGALQRPAVAGC
ncbi:hypothetical protein FGB62_150g03 [Gracilaria domingensis]|nr:hypothetical protein FGB62_150g03 [Gracilaria domingensis]